MKIWACMGMTLLLSLFACGLLAEERAAVSVGDILVYGHYEQDDDARNGAEPLAWMVLDVQDGRALLLSQQAVDSRNYHPGERETSFPTWAKSAIREWLNGDFMTAAFTEQEQAAIAEATLENKTYKKNLGGADTTDRVFLLSREEVERYLPTFESRLCTPTAYALTRGAWASTKYELNGVRCTWWWLRTPGYYRSCAASVRTRGSITSNRVYDESGAVPPAIWLDLSRAAL